ncbi:MAG: calcium-binding protein [Aestuariivirga sp.]
MASPIIWQLDLNVAASVAANSSSFIAASPEGGYSLGYDEGTEVSQHAYSSAGVYATSILVDYTSNEENSASSTYLKSGFVVTTWVVDADGAGSLDIYFQIRAGAAQNYLLLTGPVHANAVTSSNVETFPVVAPLANGNFCLAWFDSGNHIYSSAYDLLGNSLAAIWPVDPINGASPIYQGAARLNLAALEIGGYAVGYVDASGAARMSIFDHQADALVTEIDLFPGAGEEGIAGIAQLADGRIVAAAGKAGAAGLIIRFFSEAGAALTPVTDLALAGVDQDEDLNPRITALHDGRFFVVTSAATEGAAGSDIWGVVIKADGTMDGTPFQVNDPILHGVGSQSAPAIATLADGRVIVSWTDDQTGNGDIWTKIYDPRETGLRGGATGLNDDWYGTAFSDTIFLGNGKDTFHGGGSADFIYGDAGSDTLHGEASDDRIDGGAGADILIGGIGNDIFYVDNAGDDVQEIFGEGVDTVRATVDYALGADEDKLYLLGAATTGTGNGLSNFIFGNANANILNGQGGADRMYGDRGDDAYTVDSTGDLVFETVSGASGGIDSVFASANHTLSNNVENLTLTGGNINGTGNGITNIIVGNAGNNFIDGKAGSDMLTGGAGNDQFVFSTALNAATNADTILDFNGADDFFRLDDAIFTQIVTGFLSATAFRSGSAATDADDRIVYNAVTGDVFYDRDGVGGVAQVNFANIGAGTALTAADIFVF